MYERFVSHFLMDVELQASKGAVPVGCSDDPRLSELLSRFGGSSFNGGLYRVIGEQTFSWAREFIAVACPAYSGRVVPFAYDWLGRIFALDLARSEGGAPAVAMFEPGTGEVLQIPCNLETFHESELVEFREEVLAVGFHRQWLTKGGPLPKQDQCIGYRRPLFLGGKDVVENLEMSDLDVYWTLSGQLIRKTRGLPPGTQLGSVTLND